MKKPELLSPAGSLKNMRYAFAYGADAVYAGQPRYSLRVRNNEFNLDNLALAINEAHQLGKQFYVVNNIAPHNGKLKTFLKDLQPVVEMQPDAMIMSDPGLIMMAKDAHPDLNIHLSVQANAVNWATVKFWQQQGISRVILSRELSIDEIAEIRQQCPDMELEVFVHGALCMAYSGRCLLSGYINKRDPNQGTCTNACRWKYQVNKATSDELDNLQLAEGVSQSGCQSSSECNESELYLMQEAGRPGELMPAFEDEHGTYIFNSKDLRAVELVARLVEIGVDSLKIEGRTKSFYYCARTAQTYRQAIDDAMIGKPFNPDLSIQLDHLANRGYTEGFLKRHKDHSELQNYQYASSVSSTAQLVGEFIETDENGKYLIEVKNKFLLGDELELITPSGNQRFKLTKMWDKHGQPVTDAKGSGHRVWIALSSPVDPRFSILVRQLPNQQTTRSGFVSPENLATEVR